MYASSFIWRELYNPLIILVEFLSGLRVPWFLLLILEKVLHTKIISVHILVDWVSSCYSI